MMQKWQKTRERSDIYRAIFDNSLVGIALVRQRRFIRVNRKMAEIFGYGSPEDMRGQLSRICYVSDAFFDEIGRDAYSTLDEGKEFKTEFIGKRRDGSEFWCMLTGKSVVPGEAMSVDSVWIFQDVDENRRYQAQLESVAFFDPLTGLPNRRILQDQIEKAVAKSCRSRQIVAVCFVDLDDFKPINDSYGHVAGDLVLKCVAERISSMLRKDDMLSRLGGDEFVLLLDDLVRIADIHEVLAKVDYSIRKPILIGPGRSVVIGASIGVSLFLGGPAETSPEILIKNADRAMYRNKSLKATGRERSWTIYDECVVTQSNSA
ncbi:MAG: sensor domain-containing diguanylate cyclase [Gammaproteobacteria bacterium]|nr:sensor domain-containing diguanylate cyclase [Gammaproteobacteria bacterium]